MYIEIKYINLLSPRLEKFKQKAQFLWNFRCPLCGDSQKNKNKTRGFIYMMKGDFFYKCHNCGASTPFPKFLEMLDVALYKEYRMEKFKDKKRDLPQAKLEEKIKGAPSFTVDILASLDECSDLNNSHPAREYLLNRQLPLEGLYWTDAFKEWTNSIKPGTFDDTSRDEGRIIIPLRDKEGVTFGYQGRSLDNNGLRYITILIQEDAPKIFGLNRLDYARTIYVTEGPFDSLLIENAVAMAGADAASGPLDGRDCVYVYDNEPRNRQITDRIAKSIQNGDKVVIWPSNIREKDLNDMVLAGHNVQDIVQYNTYSGLSAKLKFNDWKK